MSSLCSFPPSYPFFLLSHPSASSGGCLFSNTSQPAYLIGLYCFGFVFPTPFVIVLSTPWMSRAISYGYQGVCDTDEHRSLKIMSIKMDVSVCDSSPWCLYGWLSGACMCWIRACNSVRVSECITALCMIVPSDSAIPPCCLLLFICRSFVFVRVQFHSPLLYFKLVDHVSILPH